MKTYIALFTVLALFGTGLYLSDRYERVIFAEEIAWAQCAKKVVFTYDRFLDETCTTTKIGRAKIKNNFLDLGKYGLPGLKDNAFVDYTCLQKVNLSQNRFTTIPRALKDLVNLYNLDLSQNLIAKANFPTTEHEHNLKILNLSNNQLTTLDTALLYLPGLSELYLTHNSISNIDNLEAFISLKELSGVFTTENMLKKSSLKILNLSENPLTAFPVFLDKIAPDLHTLNLGFTQISGSIFIEHFNELRTLNVVSQKVSSVTIGQHGGKNLEEINLRNNNISRFRNHNKENQVMKNIDLSHNEFTKFPYDVLFYNSLKELNFANNKLKGSLFIVGYHRHLSRLNLSNNHLRSLNFEGLKALKSLDLSHNHLEGITFSKGRNFYPSLEEIHLSHNPNFKNLPFEKLMKAAPNLKFIYLGGTGIDKDPALKLKFENLASKTDLRLIFAQ